MTVVPGLAEVAVAEVRERLGVAARPAGRARHHDLVELDWPGPAAELLTVRTVEDVFVVLGSLGLSGRVSDTKAVAEAPWWGGRLRQALDAWAAVRRRPLVKRLVWRVVVQADDVAWRQYRRQELTLAAERGLLNAGPSWRLTRDEAPLEVWMWQIGRELRAALRLTDNDDRQHGGREVERAAALRPSIAAAMVYLSRPADDDVVLDPMCGTGTLLLERAVSGRYERLLGGDNDAVAVAATLANFGPRHQPRDIVRWDARSLPLADGLATVLLCNLPWGRQVGEKAAMPELYAALVPEFARAVRPGGRLVLLTSEWDVLKDALRRSPALRLERTLGNVEVLGRRADLFVLSRV